MRGDQPHLHAFLEAGLTVFCEQPIHVEAGHFAGVANGVVLGAEFAERFDPADGTATRAHAVPEWSHADTEWRHRSHSGHEDFLASAAHLKPLNRRKVVLFSGWFGGAARRIAAAASS